MHLLPVASPPPHASTVFRSVCPKKHDTGKLQGVYIALSMGCCQEDSVEVCPSASAVGIKDFELRSCSILLGCELGECTSLGARPIMIS